MLFHLPLLLPNSIRHWRDDHASVYADAWLQAQFSSGCWGLEEPSVFHFLPDSGHGIRSGAGLQLFWSTGPINAEIPMESGRLSSTTSCIITWFLFACSCWPPWSRRWARPSASTLPTLPSTFLSPIRPGGFSGYFWRGMWAGLCPHLRSPVISWIPWLFPPLCCSVGPWRFSCPHWPGVPFWPTSECLHCLIISWGSVLLPLARFPWVGPRRFALAMEGCSLLPATSCPPRPCAHLGRLLALHFRRRSRAAPRRRELMPGWAFRVWHWRAAHRDISVCGAVHTLCRAACGALCVVRTWFLENT